jgi:hypothetical protein
MTEQGSPFEEKKWLHALRREEAHRAFDSSEAFHTYTNKATIEAANLTLRTLIIINGAAAIAVLTFLGGIASKENIDFRKVGDVAHILRYFAIGVALALAAMAFSYFTNYFMVAIESSKTRNYDPPYIVEVPRTKTMRRINRGFHIAAFLSAFLSLVLFVAGMYVASDKITHLLIK